MVLSKLTDFYPLKIPKQISTELQTLSDEPYILFIGNVYRYLTRIKEKIQKRIDEFKKQIKFNYPIVGLHIRRTDKILGAQYHNIDEYMIYSEYWMR